MQAIGRLLLLCAVLLGGAVALVGKVQNAPAPAPDPRALAVNALRVLNTAEVNHKMKFGRFAAVEEFDASEVDRIRARSFAAAPAMDLRAGGDAVAGFELRIVVAPDGRHYGISLKEKKTCGVAAFTDDVGVIFLATALGCNEK